MLSALLRSGELAWTIARAGLDQAWMSALAAVVELTGLHGGADAREPAWRRTFIADADLRLRVAAALRDDDALRSSTIVVESVYDGLVVLAGRVPALATHRRAFEVAATMPGVRRVMSTIDVAPPITAADSTNAGASGRSARRVAAPVVDKPFAIVVDAIDPTRRAATDASGALPSRMLRRRRSVAGRQHGRDPRAATPARAVDDQTPDDDRSESSSGARTA